MKTLYQLIIACCFCLLALHCSKESNSGLQNNSGAGGSTARFTISGNYLYVVDHTSLKAYDISSQQSPVLKSEQNIGINIETIFPYEDKLFIGSSSTMYIFSLTNPASPQELSRAQYQIRMACDPVVAKEGVAYATLKATGRCGGGQSALVVYDISTVSNPVLKKTISLFGPYGLGVKGNALYVCEGTGGLVVFNASNKYDPVVSSTISGETFYDVIPYGNTLIAQIEGGVALYDISNPLQPSFLSKINN